MTQSTGERDGFWAYQYRRFKTGLFWCIFGLGGLGLSLTYFPFLRAMVRDPVARRLKARAAIAASFDRFARGIEALGVMTIDRSSLDVLRSMRGVIIIANHPTILDYVLIASKLPEMDCLVKASLRHNFFLKNVIRAADYLSNDGSIDVVDECVRRLRAGESILVFPEGTRTRRNVPMTLKRGVAHAALRAGCDLAVVHIRSSHHWLDKESQWYEIPPVRPTLTFTYAGRLSSADYLRDGEDGYSLASRRLTEAMRRELSIAAFGHAEEETHSNTVDAVSKTPSSAHGETYDDVGK